MAGTLGAQLDHVAVGITEVDGVDETVVRNTARLDAQRLSLCQHVGQHRRVDLQCNMQIEVMLGLEVEGHVGRFEEGQV